MRTWVLTRQSGLHVRTEQDSLGQTVALVWTGIDRDAGGANGGRGPHGEHWLGSAGPDCSLSSQVHRWAGRRHRRH